MWLQAIIMGVTATVAIDLWALVLKHGLKLPTTNWAMVGRWFAYLPRGVFVHHPISASAPIPNELAVGWIAHYVTGIAYAAIYLALVTGFSTTPTLATAIVFGVVTVTAAWFILQPGLGVGVFASRAPRPNVIRLINLSVHTLFGAALYFGWELAAGVLPTG